MALNNYRKLVIIETAEERRTLIDEIKQSGLQAQVYSEKDFNAGNFKQPFNIYTHICYCNVLVNWSDAENFGRPTQCKIIYAGKHPEIIYYMSLLEDKSYEVNQDMRNSASDAILQSSRSLRGIVKKVENKYNTKISVRNKIESHQLINHIETPSPYKNPFYDGQTTPHVYGYDLNSAYSAYIKRYGLNWCTIPGVDYAGQEELINAAVNSELCQYIDKWFLTKSTTTGTKHDEAKRMLNLITGHIRNINPFAYKELKWGVQNKMIDVFMKQCGNPIIYSNIDSIYTIGKCDFLEDMKGVELGQFKLEHFDCNFTWQFGKLNYQINDEYPVARGIPKKRFETFELTNGRPFKLNQDILPLIKYYTDWTLETF